MKNVEITTEITIDGVPVPESPWVTAFRCSYAFPFEINDYPTTNGAQDTFSGLLHNLPNGRLRAFALASSGNINVEDLVDASSSWTLTAGGVLVLANFESGGNPLSLDNISSATDLSGFVAGND